jgi:hypothetical protein
VKRSPLLSLHQRFRITEGEARPLLALRETSGEASEATQKARRGIFPEFEGISMDKSKQGLKK